MQPKIGLQLYTVRDELAKDFRGTLERVAEIGFRYVEFADLGGLPAAEVKAMCDELGLSAFSLMTGPDALRDESPAIIENAKTLGCEYVVCAYLPGEYQADAAGYGRAVDIFKTAGKQLAEAGLTLCYHNHAFEFNKLDSGEEGFDVLYRDTPAELLKAELDVYWLKYGDKDPLAVMKDFAGRLPLLHLKDMAEAEKAFAEVGTGILDMKSIVELAPSCGVQYMIVEQDSNWAGSPLESVKISLENLRKILF